MAKTIWTNPQILTDHVDWVLGQHINEIRRAVNSLEDGENIPAISHKNLLDITAIDHHNNSNDPSSNQKAAMNASEDPSSTNPYLTKSEGDSTYVSSGGATEDLDMAGHNIMNAGDVDISADSSINFLSGTTPVVSGSIRQESGELHFTDQISGDVSLSDLTVIGALKAEDITDQVNYPNDTFTCSVPYAKILIVFLNGSAIIGGVTETDPSAGIFNLTVYTPAVPDNLSVLYIKE